MSKGIHSAHPSVTNTVNAEAQFPHQHFEVHFHYREQTLAFGRWNIYLHFLQSECLRLLLEMQELERRLYPYWQRIRKMLHRFDQGSTIGGFFETQVRVQSSRSY